MGPAEEDGRPRRSEQPESPDRPVDPALPKKKNVHAGHRQRMFRRLLNYGAEQLEDYQLLEMLLYYVSPRGDTNPMAHQLMDRFGSLRGVLEAAPGELTRLVGITDRTPALFRLMMEIMNRYQQSLLEPGEPINSSEEAAEFFRPYFCGVREELVYLLALDAKNKLLTCQLISRGTADEVLLDQRRVVQIVLSGRANRVYLAHCHVSGLASPSQADIHATRLLIQTLRPLRIQLMDHLIFADGDYLSIAQSGLLEEEAWY